MLHINLDSCSSTQTYLKEFLENQNQNQSERILVTSKEQTQGKGRGENSWHHFPGSLVMSCLVKPNDQLSSLPLKIGLILSQLIKKNFDQDIVLKWPNDLMNLNGEKIGGIICSLMGDKVIVGIGINLNEERDKTIVDFSFGHLGMNNQIIASDLAKLIYQQLIDEESTPFNHPEWEKSCFHLNKMVKIVDEFESTEGIFLGLGKNGEALVKTQDGEIKTIMSGSLFIC